LIGGSCVLQAEGHHHVAVHPVWGDESSLVLVFDLQPYLIVSRVGVNERKTLATSGGVDDLIDSREREIVFQAVLFQRCEVDADPLDLGVLLFHHDWQ
jgi:hypothetical protein